MTERVVIACLEKIFLKKYPPSDSKKVGRGKMQEWIKIFLTGFVSFAVSLSVALILRNKDRKEAAKIRKDDLEKAAKKREEDREWISKQFAESQEQTIALKEQAKSTKDLAKWSEEHIKILLDNKKVDDLGTPLSIYARESNLVTPE
ncbi:TolC family protein [Bartonella vinsonii]|uniref:TolC family protein n=1 Tax=Bartonella vinsonii TaxID=33047 RepID=UPI0003A4D62E|nr:TolC family protein [Bartonella vinsonii]